jgi:hypothetical protein
MKAQITVPTAKENWYTPKLYVEKVRSVLGSIDFDPASSPEAQETVQATEFLTENGTTMPWHGKVFLNPPYSRGIMGDFVTRMVRHRNGIMLTNSSTDTDWWHRALASCDAVCFTYGRIAFTDGDTGLPVRNNSRGQCFFLYGREYLESFKANFQDVGTIMVK